jgi:RNA polymerase sigma factor (sigma-70 family)
LKIAEIKFLVEKLIKIIKGCLDNNRQNQSELYKMFASKMYGLCLRYSGNSYDAQDILQEGFVKVFQNLKQFKWEGSFEGWMKRIFVNLALDKYRSRFHTISLDEMENAGEIYENSDISALDQLSVKDILNVLQQLPDQYRLVFNLYVIEGMSHHEIAEILKIGESTSRSNLARARNILKEKLDYVNTDWIEKRLSIVNG